ncbi:hypothetical protein CDAR_114411 [Caerostris darwini]|uniref:Uncharacterized protein n=1 Tax=Caerostris darwini TaxID=1538125 RepID=A0AAV4QW43_9ARAC|nr:hypothetical protein CDAR_114411 [Caerostris darwini]
MWDSLMSHVLEIPITINPAFKGNLKPYKGCAGKVPLKQVGRAREKCGELPLVNPEGNTPPLPPLSPIIVH